MNILQDLSAKVAAKLSQKLSLPCNVCHKIVIEILANYRDELQLVTREEFDSQCKVLKRLEMQIEILEKQLQDQEK